MSLSFTDKNLINPAIWKNLIFVKYLIAGRSAESFSVHDCSIRKFESIDLFGYVFIAVVSQRGGFTLYVPPGSITD